MCFVLSLFTMAPFRECFFILFLCNASQEEQFAIKCYRQLRFSGRIKNTWHKMCFIVSNEYTRKPKIKTFDTMLLTDDNNKGTLPRQYIVIPNLKIGDNINMNSNFEDNMKTKYKSISNTEIQKINSRRMKTEIESRSEHFSLLVSKYFLRKNLTRTLTNSKSLSINNNRNQTNITLNAFYQSLEQFQLKLYWTTFTKLASMASKERQENGISFVQSGLFLCMALLALSTELGDMANNEIENAMEFHLNDTDLTALLREVTTSLPTSSNTFKFRWATRLVLKDGLNISRRISGPAAGMKLNIESVGNIETSDLTTVLNNMVTNDSGGSMQNTFDEEELASGICAVLLTTIYVRPRWRSAPTVLNDTSPFYDADTPPRSTRMIRINDVMRYAYLDNWDAEAIEIEYGTPHLTVLLLVPRGNSLRRLASYVTNSSLSEITDIMKTIRLAVTIPLYTLRMTLLLPNKLEEMGITKLFTPKTTNASECEKFSLSHAVQRIMFWSEAGRYAFKDDGIEWDETPEKKIIVDRPYLFFVRWKNITLLNGNFVL